MHTLVSPVFVQPVTPLSCVRPFRDSPISTGFSRESHLSSKSSLASATLHQGWRLPGYQRCISWSDKAFALVPAQQHPIINKSNRKEAFVTVYLDCFSSSPLISSSENWCTLKLKRRAWQVMVSVITAQISSARAFFFFVRNCWNFQLDYLSSSASDKNAELGRYSQYCSRYEEKDLDGECWMWKEQWGHKFTFIW